MSQKWCSVEAFQGLCLVCNPILATVYTHGDTLGTQRYQHQEPGYSHLLHWAKQQGRPLARREGSGEYTLPRAPQAPLPFCLGVHETPHVLLPCFLPKPAWAAGACSQSPVHQSSEVKYKLGVDACLLRGMRARQEEAIYSVFTYLCTAVGQVFATWLSVENTKLPQEIYHLVGSTECRS